MEFKNNDLISRGRIPNNKYDVAEFCACLNISTTGRSTGNVNKKLPQPQHQGLQTKGLNSEKKDRNLSKKSTKQKQ
jgi:hypothetical protein